MIRMRDLSWPLQLIVLFAVGYEVGKAFPVIMWLVDLARKATL